MLVRARPTTSEAMSCCASPSRSEPRSPGLANRPALQQPRQKAEPGKQWVTPLPRRKLDLGTGMAINLPRDVIGAARESQARLGEAQDGKSLPFKASTRPAAVRTKRSGHFQRGL